MTALLFTIALMAAPVPAQDCASVDDGLYLRELLGEVGSEALPVPGDKGKAEIIRLRDGILDAARSRRWTPSSTKWESVPAELRPQAFEVISQLLADADPWTRGIALGTIVGLDGRRSVPLLAAMLTDNGNFDWMPDVTGYSVGAAAKSQLTLMIDGIRPRVPLDELDCPGAGGRAMQRWVRHHLPHLEWSQASGAGGRYLTSLPVRAGVPLERTASERQEVKQWLYVWPDADHGGPAYMRGAPVRFRLYFQNAGEELLWVRHDARDVSVHRLRLVGPRGTIQLPRPADLPEMRSDVPLLQGVSGQWDGAIYLYPSPLQLERIFDLSEPGTYHLYYSYVPPPAEERDPKEYSRSTDRFWEGRSYVNYYDFVIR